MADNSRLPVGVYGKWQWQAHAACRDVDTALFFHPDFERGTNRERRTEQAKAVCARCPVLAECREHALVVQEPYGTWGGLDELERRPLIRQRRRAG